MNNLVFSAHPFGFSHLDRPGVYQEYWQRGLVYQFVSNSAYFIVFENAHGADFSLGTLHYGRGGTDHLSKGSARQTFQVESFHTWAIKVNRGPSNWQDETLEWWLDGNKFFQVKGSDIGDGELWGRVAHKSFYPILNVAVGSNFPGKNPQTILLTTGNYFMEDLLICKKAAVNPTTRRLPAWAVVFRSSMSPATKATKTS